MDPFSLESSRPASAGGLQKLARLVSAPQITVPVTQRTPFGWRTFAIAPPGKGEDVQLAWGYYEDGGAGARLRLTTAWDCREQVRIEVSLATSGRSIGVMDIRQTSSCSIFEMPVKAADAVEMFRTGVRLRMVQGTEPVWFFYEDTPAGDGRTSLMPHAVLEGVGFPLAEFYNRMASRATVQPFGLREGCVLEGLWELRQAFGANAFRPAIESQLRLFFDPMGRLVYEKPGNVPADGTLWGVHGALPFTTLARIWPNHPSVDFAGEFLRMRRNSRGEIRDHAVTAEDCYCVSYPLAMFGRLRRQPAFSTEAIHQLRLRRDQLVDGEDLYQSRLPDETWQMKNWTRGVGWYLLGMVRSLVELGVNTAPSDLKDEVTRVAKWCQGCQLPNGLWPAYMDEPGLPSDTYGSAAIGAAMAHASVAGLLPPAYQMTARRTLQGLMKNLTPDGLLTGATPAYRGNEALQRSEYRVISAAGMGLMAQLLSIISRTRKA